jgi:hypothetical protein
MPCLCSYHPSDETLREIKTLCQRIVTLIKEAECQGDPIGIGIVQARELLSHLYKGNCDPNEGYIKSGLTKGKVDDQTCK